MSIVSWCVFVVYISLTTISIAIAYCPPENVFADKCYYISGLTYDWSSAEIYCQNAGLNGHLASITNGFLNTMLSSKQYLLGTTDLWLGGSRSQDMQNWMWSDGVPWSYTHWASGFPSAILSDNCITMNIDQAPRAMWQNINCSIPKAFVCESDTVTAGSTTVAAISTSTTYPPVTNPSPGFQQAANILLTGIDTTIDPCDDFYAFTCGKWLHDNPLPDGASRYGTYDMSQERIDTIIAQKLNTTDFSNPNTTDTERAATNYFKACVDNYNDDSTSNAQTLRSAIAATTLVGFPLFEPNWPSISADDLWSAIGMLESQYALGTYFESFVSVDYGDVSRNALYINQGGLLMARDFYVKPQFNRELNAYLTMTFELLQAYRYDLNVTTIDDVTLMNECQALIAFERQLAFAMAPDELLRNYQQQYNDFSLDRLNSSFPQIRWDSYLRSLLARVNPNYIRDSFVIVEPGYVNALNSLAISTPMRTLVNFAIVRFIYDNAQFLGPSYRKARRTFEVIQKNSGSIRGRRRPLLASDAEQNCVELLSAYMPYSTGYVYVSSIDTAMRTRVISDVTLQTVKVIDQFSKMIDTLPWMTAASKAASHEKSSQLIQNIGYPNWMLNRTALDAYNVNYMVMLNYTGKEQYWQSFTALKSAMQMTENFGLLALPSDRYNFLSSPATVNAWYQPERNSITFPYAAFNPPYYSIDFPQAFNYAGQGGTAGHELTHGYDDEGVQFGPDGRLSNCTWNQCTWMDDNSTQGFTDMAQCVVSQYSQQCCPVETGSVHCANGATTQGENIADLGGQQAAYFAYRDWVKTENGGVEESRLPGLEQYTPNQIFWITYGYSWCMQQSKASLVRQLLTNPHAPGKCRVNQVMQDIPQFGIDFNCNRNSSNMYPSDKQRCKVWIGN